MEQQRVSRSVEVSLSPPSAPNRLKQTDSADLVFVLPVLAVRHFDWQTSVRVGECRGEPGREQRGNLNISSRPPEEGARRSHSLNSNRVRPQGHVI